MAQGKQTLTGGPQRPAARPAPLLASVLISVCGLEMVARVTGADLIQDAASVLLLAVVALAVRRLTLREFYLIGACSLLGAFILATDAEGGAALLWDAMDQAVFLLVFILLLSLLQTAASTSPSIAVVGEYLTRQPPGRRYAGLNVGTALLAILFNIGVPSFLVPLIQRGIHRAAPGDALNPVREQRQISAMLRGFAWSVTWSPTALTPLVVADLLPGVHRGEWIGYGLAVFTMMLFVGWLEDRMKFRRLQPRGARQTMAFPRTAALRFAATTLWLLAFLQFFVWAFDESIVFGLLAACPIVVVGWLAVQEWSPGRGVPGGLGGLPGRLRQVVGTEMPDSVNVAITLAASGFIGRAAAGLTPAAGVAEVLGLATMPDWLLLGLMPPLVAMAGLVALSPTMTAVFMGSFFASLPALPADATLIAFSISCGWALSMTFTPFATVVLVVARGSGIPLRTITWGWNLGFTLTAAPLLLPVFYLLTGGR